MMESRLVRNSQQFYTSLMKVYPKEHAAEYGGAMVQVFTDQCREARQKRGFLGLSFLWLRTLGDLVKTTVQEHIQARNAKIGLPEVSPVPWKEALLVLIPGLVFLIYYAITIIWIETPFYYLYLGITWLIYLSTIPILWTWWRTKRYPVWGVIPAGLILFFIFQYLSGFQYRLKNFYLFHPGSWLLIPSIFLIVIVLLAWKYAQLWRVSRTVLLWSGICIFTSLLQVGWMVYYDLMRSSGNWYSLCRGTMLSGTLEPWAIVQDMMIFLLFIIITAFIARKYGKLSILFLLGYTLTKNIYGVFQGQGVYYSLTIAYRLLMTIVLPLWAVRATSERGRYQSIILPIVFAITAQVIFQSGLLAFGWFFEKMPMTSPTYPSLLTGYYIFEGISLMVGFVLAIHLCNAGQPSMADSINQAEVTPSTVKI